MRPKFWFWKIMSDGTAEASDDEEAVNRGDERFFGSIEGAIVNGGVRATAFERKIEKLYDTKAFFDTGTLVPVDEVVITKITAERN